MNGDRCIKMAGSTQEVRHDAPHSGCSNWPARWGKIRKESQSSTDVTVAADRVVKALQSPDKVEHPA
ncbi:unnamed protein product [Toxocara canis]|uniref:Uncharacterized protein n=1 Tax=Toxocara canis TaxID=6265 RepID=A0A183UZC0_TOXCA|nr:unnamed protein product [Toxocara canis]